MPIPRQALLTVIMTVAMTGAAAAHGADAAGGGFVTGFMHPILGWDHVAAMVAVGLWGAFLGAPAVWVLPIVFPLVMALGGAWGVAGLPIPAVEVGIALTAVVIGLAVLLALRPSFAIAAVVVGAFAVFHGYAHGVEMPVATNAFAYAIGFVVATGLLHVAGILLGSLTRVPVGRIAVRGAGGLIALAGLGFLTGAI